MIEEAKRKLKKIKEPYIINAFKMIGWEYLQNEAIFYNDFDGIYELIEDFNLPPNEIIKFILNNENYNEKDTFIIFNGHDLWSMNNLEYTYKSLEKHMNMEVAEYLLSNSE